MSSMTSRPCTVAELGSLPLSATWTTSAPNDDLWSGRLVIVVDAPVLANALADDEEDGDIARRELRAADEVIAPDLVDVETVSVLRRRCLHHTLTAQRFAAAIAHLQQLQFERVPTLRLMRRAFELRANVSAYDACYVALAERASCELVTMDERLSAAAGTRCPIRVLR